MLSVGRVVEGESTDDDDNDDDLCMLEVVVCDNVDVSLLEVKDDEIVAAIKIIDIIYGTIMILMDMNNIRLTAYKVHVSNIMFHVCDLAYLCKVEYYYSIDQ